MSDMSMGAYEEAWGLCNEIPRPRFEEGKDDAPKADQP